MCQPTQAADDARHEAPRALALLAAGPDPAYDDLVRLAAQVCGTPMALLALLDQHHVRLIARLGVDADQVPREGSLCARTAAAGDLLVVTDADAGPACAEQSLVTGAERVRFFAAVPLLTTQGQSVGALGVLDRVPRSLTAAQQEGLRAVARQAMLLLEGHRLGARPKATRQVSRRPRAAGAGETSATARPRGASARAPEASAGAAMASAALPPHPSERALAEGRFEALFRAFPGVVVVSTLGEGRCLDVNDAFLRLTGYRREEAVGRTLLETNLLADAWERARIRQMLRDQRAIDCLPVRLRTPAGGTRAGLLSAAVVRLGLERLVLTVISDVTEHQEEQQARQRREAQAQLVQKRESLGRLASTIGHDFNNLLTGILGHAGLALAQLPEGEARNHLAAIEQAATRAATLTQQLLTYAGEGQIASEAVSLTRLVEGMGDLLQAAATR